MPDTSKVNPNPQPLSREERESRLLYAREIGSIPLQNVLRYEATCTALEQERDALDIKLRDLRRCHVEVLEDLRLEPDATPEQAREVIESLRKALLDARDALRKAAFVLEPLCKPVEIEDVLASIAFLLDTQKEPT